MNKAEFETYQKQMATMDALELRQLSAQLLEQQQSQALSTEDAGMYNQLRVEARRRSMELNGETIIENDITCQTAGSYGSQQDDESKAASKQAIDGSVKWRGDDLVDRYNKAMDVYQRDLNAEAERIRRTSITPPSMDEALEQAKTRIAQPPRPSLPEGYEAPATWSSSNTQDGSTGSGDGSSGNGEGE